MPPGTMSSILLAKHVSFELSVSSPRPVITSRREKKNNKANVFQHPIHSHSQSASSWLISPHFAAGAVEVGVGRGAASFLATESTGTDLIPRLMTRIAGGVFTPLGNKNQSEKHSTSKLNWFATIPPHTLALVPCSSTDLEADFAVRPKARRYARQQRLASPLPKLQHEGGGAYGQTKPFQTS